MPKLRDFSGKEVLSFFESHGFSIISQHGSHIKLRRVVENSKQTLIIPNHSSIHKGTIREIFNQAIHYISEENLRAFFYTK
jgi:predicted RNA binding protein YcfA (HicA-like mRNA interferase family)